MNYDIKKKLSEETKQKISAAKKANHPMRGRHWPEEVREKIRAANIGQNRSEQTRHNISLGLKVLGAKALGTVTTTAAISFMIRADKRIMYNQTCVHREWDCNYVMVMRSCCPIIDNLVFVVFLLI